MLQRLPLQHCLLLAFTLLAVLATPARSQESDFDPQFDHYETRFPLAGAHERVACENCHAHGSFRGTPTRCAICHDASGTRSQSGKGLDHIRSTDDCDDCHLLRSWIPSRIDHAAVLGSCATCHDGSRASGKPALHPASSNRCEDCHRTTNWLGATFDHSGVSSGCYGCHNGSAATGKNPGHIASSNECELCHDTRSWENATFDHSSATGPCASCHDGFTATGKPPGHFTTALACDLCHTNNAWLPARYSHVSAAYPGDHAGSPACSRCHAANNAAVVYPAPYGPDCAGCHATDFAADHHTKVDSPRILYTTSELRDCTGACHLYTDATFTVIERARSGEHRVNASGW